MTRIAAIGTSAPPPLVQDNAIHQRSHSTLAVTDGMRARMEKSDPRAGSRSVQKSANLHAGQSEHKPNAASRWPAGKVAFPPKRRLSVWDDPQDRFCYPATSTKPSVKNLPAGHGQFFDTWKSKKYRRYRCGFDINSWHIRTCEFPIRKIEWNAYRVPLLS